MNSSERDRTNRRKIDSAMAKITEEWDAESFGKAAHAWVTKNHLPHGEFDPETGNVQLSKRVWYLFLLALAEGRTSIPGLLGFHQKDQPRCPKLEQLANDFAKVMNASTLFTTDLDDSKDLLAQMHDELMSVENHTCSAETTVGDVISWVGRNLWVYLAYQDPEFAPWLQTHSHEIIEALRESEERCEREDAESIHIYFGNFFLLGLYVWVVDQCARSESVDFSIYKLRSFEHRPLGSPLGPDSIVATAMKKADYRLRRHPALFPLLKKLQAYLLPQIAPQGNN